MDIVHSVTAHKHKQLAKPEAREGSFYGYNVSRVDNMAARLTVFLDVYHSFVRLQNSARDVDMIRGFYPDGIRLKSTELPRQCERLEEIEDHDLPDDGESVQNNGDEQSPEHIDDREDSLDVLLGSAEDVKKENIALFLLADQGSVSLYNLFSGTSKSKRLEVQGSVDDEWEHYHDESAINSIPRVNFAISGREALEVEKFIIKHTYQCDGEEPECTYRVLGYNCMDFSQAVFEQTSYPGHFIGYFPGNAVLADRPMISAYAALSHPVVPLAGHTALAALTVFWVIPKISSAVTSIGGWLASLAGSTPEHEVSCDIETVKNRYQYVKECFWACEPFWYSYPERNKVTERLIGDSTDLQFRFVDIEKRVEESLAGGHTDTLQPHVYKELEKLEQDFRELEKNLKKELVGHPDLLGKHPPLLP